jgi:uncharacterized membrane protein
MQAQMSKNRILLIIILFAIAFALHLPGISFHSLWFDETSTAYMVSQHGYDNLFKSLFTFEGTPPLFFVLEKAFVKVFNLPVNEFSLRFLPVVYGSIACVLVFFIFFEMSGGRTAILAFFAVAFSSFYAYLFHEARCYSMLAMMALLLLWVTMQWLKKPTIRWLIALFISVALMVQIHYFALFWVAAICTGVFIIRKKDKQLIVFLVCIMSASCISFGSLLPLFGTQLTHEIGHVRDYLTAKWFIGIFYSPIKVLVGAGLFKIYSIREISTLDVLTILPVAALVIVAGYFLLLRFAAGKTVSDAEKFVVFSVCFAFLFHVLLGSKIPTVHPRYMSHFLILLSGLALAGFGRHKKLQILFFSCFILVNCIANIKYYERSLPYIEPWNEIADAVDQCIDRDGVKDKTIIGAFVTCHALAFYLKDKTAEFYCIPSYTTQTDFARLNVFGNTFYSHLYHYDFHPVCRRASFLDIVKDKSEGLLLTKDKSGPANLNKLKADFKGVIDFSLLRIFKTNQGDLSVLSWRYIGIKAGT